MSKRKTHILLKLKQYAFNGAAADGKTQKLALSLLRLIVVSGPAASCPRRDRQRRPGKAVDVGDARKQVWQECNTKR